MGTNKELLSKGIKYLGGALPLLFIGPSIIYMPSSTSKIYGTIFGLV
jgi:hypothetical protein